MKQILLLILIVIVVFLFTKMGRNEVLMVESLIDNNDYLVNNVEDRQQVADLLASVRTNLFKLKDYLIKNVDKYDDYVEYINLLDSRLTNVIIKENTEDNNYTSYSINKGEEIVFCVRSKINKEIHDINLVMYVALHEISHVACPEVGHTELFKKIFKFFLEIGMEIGIYKYVDYSQNAKEYCGIYINERIH
jgi:hypothetical protein